MDIDKLEGNSYKSKEEYHESRLGKYDIQVKTKKPSKVSKFAKSVIAEDAKNVGSYIFMDVLLPALKKLIVDIVENGIRAMVYGDNAPTRRSSSNQKVSYSSLYSSNSYSRTRASELRNRPVYDMDDIVFDSRGRAEEILEDIKDCLSREKDSCISIGEIRDSLGLSTTSSDWKYGWTGADLQRTEVARTIDGNYVIDFPKFKPLD